MIMPRGSNQLLLPVNPFFIALTLVLISIITFAVTNILPGDVAMMVLGTQSNPAALAGLLAARRRVG